MPEAKSAVPESVIADRVIGTCVTVSVMTIEMSGTVWTSIVAV